MFKRKSKIEKIIPSANVSTADVLTPHEKISILNSSKAEAFLCEYSHEIDKVNFEYYVSNPYLTENEKNKIRKLYLEILKDMKIVAFNVCQTKEHNDVEANRKANKVLNVMQNNFDTLDQADHLSFEICFYGSMFTSPQKAIEVLKIAGVSIYESMKKLSDENLISNENFSTENGAIEMLNELEKHEFEFSAEDETTK